MQHLSGCCLLSTPWAIDKYDKVSYYIHMINKIKNKYYTYTPNEFLPVYSGGELINKKEFHLYKVKKALAAADNVWMSVVNRAHSK